MFNIIQIIKEEINRFYSDWSNSEEPSLADRLYQKKYNIETPKAPQEINAELVGVVTKQATRPLNPGVPVYKNPRNLQGFANNTRGILLATGDFYVAQNANALHANMLDLLADKGIVPYASKFDYEEKYPNEFVAVQRNENTNQFGQSSAYNEFPNHYLELFNVGNMKQPYKFEEFIFDYN